VKTETIKRLNGRMSLANQVLVQIVFWLAVVHLTQRHHLAAWTIAVDALLLLWGVLGLAAMALAGVKLPRLVLGLLSTLSLLLVTFSWFYWEYGDTANFTRPLTHLDALYFTLGTLTTAGTGSFAATSQTAVGIQTAQMAVDLTLTLFVAGVVVARFAPPLVRAATATTQARQQPSKGSRG